MLSWPWTPQTSSSSHPSLLGQSLIGHKWIRNSCVVKRQPAPVQSHKNLKLKKWREVKEEEKEERMCFHPSIFKTTSPAQAIPGCIGGRGRGRVHPALTQGLREDVFYRLLETVSTRWQLWIGLPGAGTYLQVPLAFKSHVVKNSLSPKSPWKGLGGLSVKEEEEVLQRYNSNGENGLKTKKCCNTREPGPKLEIVWDRHTANIKNWVKLSEKWVSDHRQRYKTWMMQGSDE